jgi:hypothetical protein
MRNLFKFGLLVLMTSQLFADVVYSVSIDTSTLPSSSGPYQIYLSLIDGSGTGDGNNTVTLDDFSCTGVSMSGCPAGVYSLTDYSFFNTMNFGFTAGGELRFLVGLTGNLDANLVPDSFQLSILDGNVNPLPTTDPSGSDAVLFSQFDQSNPVLLGYGSPAGAAITLSTPVIDLKAIPEPRIELPIGLGLYLMFLLGKHHSHPGMHRASPPPCATTVSLTKTYIKNRFFRCPSR